MSGRPARISARYQASSSASHASDAFAAGYDLGKAKADGGGGGSADALNGSPPAGLTTDADLQYYVTYEGANGWLELEGFSMALANSGGAGGITKGAPVRRP